MPPNRYATPEVLADIRRLKASLHREGTAYRCEGEPPRHVALTAADVLAMRQKKPPRAPKPPIRQPGRPRNPRICAECEGPCRPGAGVCDRCRKLDANAAT